MLKYSILVSFVSLVFFAGCSLEKKPPKAFVRGIGEIKSTFAPDKRTTVFSVDAGYRENQWYISGETSVPGAYDAVKKLAQETFPGEELVWELEALPLSSFADTTQALVNVSVGNLRRYPKHASEMMDQVIMGIEVRLLKKESYWYLVQTPYEYIGWITRGSISRKTDSEISKWNNSDKYTLIVNFDQIFSEPSGKSQVVSDLVLGSVFIKKSQMGKWMEIELPDGRSGCLPRENIKPYKAPDNSVIPKREAIIEMARKMMGIPYLWGGNSTKAMDCSGFTGTVFRAEGFQLPRDANMQVKLGEEVAPNDEYSNVFPGDLIFFGPPNRITHVGICLGGSYFIHESGDVHINSLDEDDELFNAYRKNTLRHIKRIIKD